MKLAAVVRALRPHQWSKNLLVFVSMIVGHQLRDPALLGLTTVCFVAFCLAASGGYLVNDLVDLRDDRAHAAKRQRPLASGAISVRCGVLLAATLLASALALACALSTEMLLCIAGYMLASQTYTFWAKRKLALDILFLVGLYISRIIAGVLVAGAEPSFWLLAFSMFVFFSLACLKRFVEISSRDGEELEAFSARAYRSSDTLTVAVLGMASGLLSVLVLAFYVNSREVTALYAHPGLLWLVCPLLLYWVSRAWMLAGRNQVHDDPIVFALRDPTSYALLASLAVIAVAAT